jgi:hypothetical protein
MLNANALITVEELKSFLEVSDADIQAAFLSIYNSSADASAASVRVTDTQIILTVTGGTNAGTSTLTLADADKNTLTELATAITALNKGWIVNLQGASDISSWDLTVIEAMGCLGSANLLTLCGTATLKLERYINDASAFLERATARTFKAANYTEYLDGEGQRFLWLEQFPVNSLTSLQIVSLDGTVIQTLTANVDFVLYPNTGKLDSLGRWGHGIRNIKAVYSGGYTAIPQDLKLLAMNLIQYWMNRKGKDGVDSVTIGSFSETFVNSTYGELPVNISADIQKFKRMIF